MSEKSNIEKTKPKGRGLTLVVQEALKDVCKISSMDAAPDLFIDWGDKEKFHVKTAKGECAA